MFNTPLKHEDKPRIYVQPQELLQGFDYKQTACKFLKKSQLHNILYACME